VQCDVPEELFLRPASPTVARFFGVRNVLSGEVRDGRMETAAGAIPVTGGDGPARVAVRPERIGLDEDAPLRMTVLDATFLGASVRVRLGEGAMRLEAHVRPDTAPPAGGRVGVSIPPGAVWRFPDDEVVPSMDRDAARP
jgi:ABC-type Fe3+/spermidine/putrescine transport system ATPase subunit